MKDKKRIEEKLKIIEKHLTKMPKGKLVCCHDSKHTKYYQSDGHQKKYIPKRNRKLAEKLAVKKYLTLLQEEFQQELLAIEFYCRHYPRHIKSSEYLTQIPEFSEIIKSIFISEKKNNQEILEWINTPYNQNHKNPENLIHRSSSGNVLRSKSEYIIDMNLHMRGIPFKYECELKLNNVSYYPDFTILNKRTGRIYYWEHLGMMDNADYIAATMAKIKVYVMNGIIPGINLILTAETKDEPMDTEKVEQFIESYFV